MVSAPLAAAGRPPLAATRRSRGTGLRRASICGLLACTAALALPAPASAADTDAASRIRTAYLLNFAKFTRWPAADASRALRACLVADVAFGGHASGALQGQRVQGRVVDVREFPADVVPVDADCDLVYLQAGRMIPLVGALTVGEGPDFAADGGMIGFVERADRIRFVVNLPAVRAQGLDVDARLLGVAAEVRR